MHIEDRREKDGTIKLTQEGLIKKVIEALDVGIFLLRKPRIAEPLMKDLDGDLICSDYQYASLIGMLQ